MARDNGIGSGYEISVSLASAVVAFLAIAFYNVIELTAIIFTTFRRRSGLYFYSLLVAAWGIIPYGMAFVTKFFLDTTSTMVVPTLVMIGWPAMVTGQSLVLYSRLHLIARGTVAGGKWVLVMICVNAIIGHLPIAPLIYGANSKHPERFITPYSIYEKIQVSIFFLQEVIISSIYLWRTWTLIRSEGQTRRAWHKVMKHLIWVNVTIIVLDITLLAFEYAGLYVLQVTYKAAVYSIKLKMEFSILNRLLDLFQGRVVESFSEPLSNTRSGKITFGSLWKSRKSAAPAGPGAGGAAPQSAGPHPGGIALLSSLSNSRTYERMDDDKSLEVEKTEALKRRVSARLPGSLKRGETVKQATSSTVTAGGKHAERERKEGEVVKTTEIMVESRPRSVELAYMGDGRGRGVDDGLRRSESSSEVRIMVGAGRF